MEKQWWATLGSGECAQGGSSHPALPAASSPGSETSCAFVSHSMVYGPMGHDLQFLKNRMKQSKIDQCIQHNKEKCKLLF